MQCSKSVLEASNCATSISLRWNVFRVARGSLGSSTAARNLVLNTRLPNPPSVTSLQSREGHRSCTSTASSVLGYLSLPSTLLDVPAYWRDLHQDDEVVSVEGTHDSGGNHQNKRTTRRDSVVRILSPHPLR